MLQQVVEMQVMLGDLDHGNLPGSGNASMSDKR